MFKFPELAYQRYTIEELESKVNERLEGFAQAESAADQYEHWQAINAIMDDFSTQSTLCSIRSSLDARNEFYEKEMEYYAEISPRAEELGVRFNKLLVESPYRKELEEKVGDTVFKMAEQHLLTFDPSIAEELVAENKLVIEYDKLVATGTVEFQGENYPLTRMGAFMQNEDPAVRREAFRAHTGFYEKHQAEFDRIYSELVEVRHRMAQKLGFQNYIALGYARMGRLDYGEKEVAAYRESVRENIVPLATTLRERQRQRLGLDSLSYFDEVYEFPGGNPKPIGTEAELVEKARKMYEALSPETNEFFQFMLDHQLMDLDAREGKRGGGYCTYLPAVKAPFIFANFNGTAGDVDVLTHEAGHAFQCFRSRHALLPEYVWATMDASEIHSMSMEFFTWDYMEPFFGDKTTKYNFSHIAGALLFIPYGCLVDHFQHEVYSHPEWTAEDRRQCWIKLEKEYLPHRNYEDLKLYNEGGFWFKQSHIFQVPFYYIDYTLAQNCALQYWKWSREDFATAWQHYVNLCNQGGRYSFLKLVEIAGLKNPFDPATLPSVVKEIADYLNSVSEEELV